MRKRRGLDCDAEPAALQADLERCAAAHGAMAAIIAELAERRERAISDRRNI